MDARFCPLYTNLIHRGWSGKMGCRIATSSKAEDCAWCFQGSREGETMQQSFIPHCSAWMVLSPALFFHMMWVDLNSCLLQKAGEKDHSSTGAEMPLFIVLES